MAITIGPHMLHSTPAMPARTSQTAGGASGAILASSQHSSWHHQSKYHTSAPAPGPSQKSPEHIKLGNPFL